MREEPVSQRVTKTGTPVGPADPLGVRFEAAWQAGSTPRIEDYLGMEPGEGQTAELRERLAALVAIDLRYRWRSSPSETLASRAPTESTLDSAPALPSHPRLEDYLRRYPALGPLAELPESLILAEYQARHAYGDMPSHVEYRERFPAVAARLDDFLTAAGQSQAGQPSWILTPPSVDAPAVPSLSLDEFLVGLAESRLLSEEELAAIREELAPGEEPQDGGALAERLVAAGKLTRYQVEAIGLGQAARLVLGEYVLLERLGAGGMGEVFKARHRTMRRIVALKVLAPRLVHLPEALKRFHHEVQAAARLIHPNIVTAFDAGEQAGIHYLVMEYVDGQDLGRLLRGGPLPLTRAIDYILQVARGLDYAHRQGVIHRDIKPANLLLDRQGTVKILDMGLARMEETLAGEDRSLERLTSTGQVMGTCDYMAPEQAEDTSQADARSDLYALGCSLYHLLTGHPPYRGKSFMQVLVAHRDAPISSLRADREDLPESLEKIYRQMVAKRPADRYQSAAELVADLEAFREETVLQRGVGSTKRPDGFRGLLRRKSVLGALAGGLVGLSAVAALLWGTRSGSTGQGKQLPSSAIATSDTAIRPLSPASTSAREAATASPLPEPVALSLTPKPQAIKPGKPLSRVALASRPAAIAGVQSWSLETIACRGKIACLAYSPDGKILATGGADGAIRLWDASSGKCLRIFLGHDQRPDSLSWSPDSKYLAASDSPGGLRIWDIATGRTVPHQFFGDIGPPGAYWSPKGRFLVAWKRPSQLLIASATDMGVPRSIDVPGGPIGCVVWSPDEQRLASAGPDGLVRIWSIATAGLEREIRVATGGTTYVAWSPDGKAIATSTPSVPNAVRLWNPRTGERSGELTFSSELLGEAFSLAWSPDGQLLAGVRNGPRDNVCLWNKATGKVEWSFSSPGQPSCVPQWTPDGKRFAMPSATGSQVLVCDVHARQVTELGPKPPCPAGNLRFSPDGKRLALANGDQGVWIWPLESAQLPRQLKGTEARRAVPVAWSGDDRLLVTKDPDGNVEIWDAAKAQSLRQFRAANAHAGVAISPDGTQLAIGGPSVDLWDVSSGDRRWTVPVPSSVLAFSPDGKSLAVVLPSPQVSIFDPQTGARHHEFKVPSPPAILAWSPDSSRLATAGKEIEGDVLLWEMPGGKLLQRLNHKGHGIAKSLRWARDGKTLIVRSTCMHGIIWDAPSGQRLREPFFVWFGCEDTDVAPDGSRIATRAGRTICLENVSDATTGTSLVCLPSGQMVVDPSGHYVGTPGIENDLVYVAQTDAGQETLTPEEFSRKYGWKNDSGKVAVGVRTQAP